MRALTIHEQDYVAGGWITLVGRAAVVIGGFLASWAAGRWLDERADNSATAEDEKASLLEALRAECGRNGFSYLEGEDGSIYIKCAGK
jgi:hypothetical protein